MDLENVLRLNTFIPIHLYTRPVFASHQINTIFHYWNTGQWRCTRRIIWRKKILIKKYIYYLIFCHSSSATWLAGYTCIFIFYFHCSSINETYLTGSNEISVIQIFNYNINATHNVSTHDQNKEWGQKACH